MGSSLERNRSPEQANKQVNSIRFFNTGSLLVNGEPCVKSATMPGDTTRQNVEVWVLRDGWSKDVGKGAWDNVESWCHRRCASIGTSSQSAHSSAEAGNDRGAKEHRKVKP